MRVDELAEACLRNDVFMDRLADMTLKTMLKLSSEDRISFVSLRALASALRNKETEPPCSFISQKRWQQVLKQTWSSVDQEPEDKSIGVAYSLVKELEEKFTECEASAVLENWSETARQHLNSKEETSINGFMFMLLQSLLYIDLKGLCKLDAIAMGNNAKLVRAEFPTSSLKEAIEEAVEADCILKSMEMLEA